MAATNPRFANVKACVFDAYGTLFDFASACKRCADELSGNAAALTALWRDKQLQYTWLRSLEGRHADFWQVTGDALDYALDTLAIADRALRERLLNLYLTLDTFPEVPAVLRELKGAGFATAILSNGSLRMLTSAVDHARIGGHLDAIISVEEAGIFKPHPKVYALAPAKLAVAVEEIVFLSSNAWDAYAASAYGMPVVWCNRYGQRPERLPGAPDAEIRTLAGLPALLARS
jgi:2-haloacid dehalogenase